MSFDKLMKNVENYPFRILEGFTYHYNFIIGTENSGYNQYSDIVRYESFSKVYLERHIFKVLNGKYIRNEKVKTM